MSTEIYTPARLRETAARLAGALRSARSPEYRLAILKRLARRLGDGAYPVFLKLLSIIAESDDDVAKAAIAEALVLALNRMDLPSGHITSWGGSNLRGGEPEGSEPVASTSPRRQLGPIEFLTAWYAQRTQLPQLDEKHYAQTLSLLIELCNHSPELSRLYPAKLDADSRSELEGAYTRVTRDTLAAIAKSWNADAAPAEVARSATAHEAGLQAIPRGWILRDL